MKILTIFFCFAATYSYAGDTLYSVVTVNGKMGMKDAEGHFVISPKYDGIGWTEGESTPIDGVIGYKIDGKWGLINVQNQRLTSAKYNNLLPYLGKKYIASIQGKFSKTAFYGVISDKGKSLVDFKYYALKKSNQYLIALDKTNQKFTYGLIDQDGQQILPFVYRGIQNISASLIQAEISYDSLQLFNTKSSMHIDGSFNAISRYIDGFYQVFTKERVGVVDSEGKVIVEPLYEQVEYDIEAGWRAKSATIWSVLGRDYELVNEINCVDLMFENDYIKTKTISGENLMNAKFEYLLPKPIEKIQSITGSKVLYVSNKAYGLFDLSTNSDVKTDKFDTAFVQDEFIYGAKRIKNNLKWALYDTFGIKRTHFDYDQINCHKNRLFAVKRRGFWGFMNRTGKEVIHCVYSEVGDFNDGLVVVKYHDEYGVINRENNWVVLPQKGKIELIDNKLYMLKMGETTKLMSMDGEMIYFTDNKLELLGDILIETLSSGEKQLITLSGTFLNRSISSGSYDELKYVEDEYVAVKKNNRFGFVDKHNKLRITNRYEDVGRYSEHGIPVMLLGKWGMIDTNEKIIIQPAYDSIFDPNHGISIIELKGKYGLINYKGTVIISPKFDKITQLKSGEYLFKEDGKYGLLDAMGKYLIESKYDELIKLEHGVVIAKKRGKYGTLTLQGVEVLPNVFDQIYYHAGLQLYFTKREGQWNSLAKK